MGVPSFLSPRRTAQHLAQIGEPPARFGTPDSGCREILAQRERTASRVARLGQRVPLFMQFSFENLAKGAIL